MPTRLLRVPHLFATASLLLALCCPTSVLPQSLKDPDAPRVEQAALAFVKLLDDDRYDEAAATLRAGAVRFGALAAVGGGVPGEAELQQQLDARRERGRLSNRQAIVVFVQPLQSVIVAGREPAKQVRQVRVDFDTDPETPMLDRRRNAARYYRESVGGFLMPDGELLLTSYMGAPLHASDRVAGTTGAAGAQAAAAAATGTGASAPEAVATERALQIAKLLDAGQIGSVLVKIRAGMPEHYATDAQWAPVAQRLTSDFARRVARGSLSDRKVLGVMDGGGQGTYMVTLGATGANKPIPPRYGPNPMGSVETVRVQVFGGAVRELDYRFGF